MSLFDEGERVEEGRVRRERWEVVLVRVRVGGLLERAHRILEGAAEEEKGMGRQGDEVVGGELETSK